MLTSAKGLQSKMAQYAFRVPTQQESQRSRLKRTFEDRMKCVEELVAFLSNHKQEALERTGKQNLPTVLT